MKFIILDDDQIIYHSPLPPGDVAALQELLRQANCLVPSFVDADAYSVETYIAQYARERTETTFLFDRNLYSQVVALAKGSRATENARFAAAVMAFASCANTQIEPNLALYEGAASGARRAWKRDLEIFHKADDIHPANWAALALGYAERFDRRIPGKRLRSELAKNFDPAAKLRFYGFVYPIALKMATISMAGGKADKEDDRVTGLDVPLLALQRTGNTFGNTSSVARPAQGHLQEYWFNGSEKGACWG